MECIAGSARSIAMQLRTRVSLVSLFAASAVAATVLAWHAQRDQPARVAQVSAVPVVAAESMRESPQVEDTQQVEDTRQGEGEGEAPGPDAPSATVDKLELGWMPKGYVREVGDDHAEALAQLVEAWAANDSEEPRIEYRKGVVFARSAEDRGDDRPYPRSASPQGQRVCGQASVWMREALRQRLADEALTCDRNVCRYGGMEYAPDGYLVFRETMIDGEAAWALDAWVEVYRAALDPESAERNQADVVRAHEAQAGTRCAGEPVGAY